MDWKEGFIRRVLAAVPAGSWRRRMEAELRDHLDSQCRALAEAGRTQDEARAEALRLMGEPEKLKKEYEAAWRRRPEAKLRGAAGWLGAVIVGGILLYAAFCITFLPLSIPMSVNGGLLRNGAFQFLAGNLTFWAPFAVAAAFLRLCTRNYRHRGVLISAGLLIIWTLGTAVLVMFVLGVGEYEQYGLLPSGWLDRLALFYRDMRHSNAPWITPGYHLMNLAGCGFLGWLFGRRPAGANRRQTA